MAQNIEKVMEMTLDEYIASFKAEKKSSGSSVQKTQSNESKFKAERRASGKDEEGEEDDEDYKDFKMELGEESNGIWRGPSSTVNYIDLDAPQDDSFDALLNDEAHTSTQTPQRTNSLQRNNTNNQNQMVRQKQNYDLRNKITGNKSTSNDLMPNSHSQQWRLIQPNVMPQRPAGMPPLVPQNAMQESYQSKQQNYRRNNRFNNRQNNRNGFYNNRNNNFGGNGFSGSFNSSFNNGRVQRFDQYNSHQEMLNKNIKAVLDQLNNANSLFMPKKAQDLTIECSSDSINLSSDSCHNSTLGLSTPQPANIRMTLPTQQSWQSASSCSNNSNKSNDNLRSLLGINDTGALKNEMMPMLATKFLDFFQNFSQQTMHKPIYDMKVQKEIHELQKKPLLYKCPGGEVVSSDGVGINCEIIPRASGISLNHRFA